MFKYTNILDRFLAKLSIQNECIVWTGSKNNSKYGWIMGRYKSIAVHIFSYELHYKEQVPKNMEIHHKCFNRLCVNPDHLELVTSQQNMRLSNTHCKKGHELTEDNIIKDKGKRRCKKCRIEYRKKYWKTYNRIK